MGKKAVVVAAAAGTFAYPAPISAGAWRPNSPRYAHEQNDSCNYRTSFAMGYGVEPGQSGTNVDVQFRDDVTAAAEAWDALITPEAATRFTTTHPGTIPASGVYVYEDIIEGQYASTRCSGTLRVRLNPETIGNDADHWFSVAAHEFGHMHGLSHTSALDNTISASVEPYMQDCRLANAAVDARGVPRIDDEAQINDMVGARLSSDGGFENPQAAKSRYWTYTNANYISDNPNNGNFYTHLHINESKVSQAVHVEWPDIAARGFRVRSHYKAGSGFAGTVNYKVYARGRDLPTAVGCEAGNFTDGWNFNAPLTWSTSSEVMVMNYNSPTPTAAWTPLSTSAQFTISSAVNPALQRRMNRFRIQVTNGTSNAAPAFVDDTWLELL